ncbi:aquaporin-like protein [Aaosphaeria arxii CBS 175.79]|uniref:Aquaporin-like protein n=1 Tax=Aaosphaeria arxii CBS 175.79 TaxID=1450172 RepID=A0A6A5YBZ8_9PLEO|nr:aquaporin-like protein [Aaosphaeria arxii CBS 175.79]KAF2022154.1 aquaporin-like protein [Aaosphaeria arxii CBS 175.79]
MVLPGMKPAYTTDPKHQGEKRLPGVGWLPNRVRHIIISMLGEFVGTFLFLFFAFAGTQVANTPPGEAGSPPSVATLLYISLAFGFSLAVNVWIFFRISGGLFNPAVSVALALVGAQGWVKAALLIVAQLLAGISAAGIVSTLFPGDLTVRTTLSEGTSTIRGLFIEVFLTFELIFCIFMLAAEKHKATFLAPVGIGLSLFIAELAGVYFTGGSLNPARSLGPDVILGTFDSYHWIYWVGPLVGAVLAVVFYRLIKALEYETANPGADGDGQELRYQRPETPVGDNAEARQSSTGLARRTTDGTDDSDFLPPIHPINKPFTQPHFLSSSHYTTTSASSAHSQPTRPPRVYRHGLDGNRSASSSESALDHPNDRPRAQHRRSTIRPSRARSETSDSSYRSGPSLESRSSSASGRYDIRSRSHSLERSRSR